MTLGAHRPHDFRRFEEGAAGYEEIIDCYNVSGGYDYLVRFMTRSIQHYQEVIEELLDKNIGISKYFSYIVIKSPVMKDGVPLRKLLRH